MFKRPWSRPAAASAASLLWAIAGCSGGESAHSDASPAPSEVDPFATPGFDSPPGSSASPGVNPNDPALPGDPTLPSDPNAPETTTPPSPNGTPDPANPGSPSDPNAPPGASESGACARDATVGTSPLRRLTRLEYQLTLQELFQLEAAPDVAAIPEDPKYKNFRTLAELQTVSAQHLRSYADVAQRLAAQLLADTERSARVIGCSLDQAGCLADFTARFGRLAYRRTLDEEEVSSLTERANELAETPSDAFAFVIEALLASPSFVFRVEVGDSPEELSTLSGSELASKLSFSILGRAPDDELLSSGESGGLATPEGLREAAAKLVTDPRAREYFRAFFQQWLDFEQMRPPPMPPQGFSDALLPQMAEETERLLADFAWGGANFLDVLGASYTYARPELAAFQGLPSDGVNPDGATRIDFAMDHPRYGTGLLTHGALIGAKGDGDIIAHRGKWLLSTFLCQDLEIPAGLLNSLGDELEGLTRTQMLEKRNEDARCSSCHQVIDPIGVGFAQYDSAGRFNETVSLDGFPLAPALAGSEPPEFSSIAELASKLRARSEVPSCLSERLFLFTQGREPTADDACAVEAATTTFAAESYSFERLLLALVESPEFRLRRAAPPASSTGVE